jgi:hypothetical protein
LIARRDLAAGCVLYTTFDKLRSTVWADEGVDARRTIADELRAAFDVARRLGSTRLAILGGAEEKRPLPLQHAALIRNLRHAADWPSRLAWCSAWRPSTASAYPACCCIISPTP